MSFIRYCKAVLRSKELYMWFVILFPYFAIYLTYSWYKNEIENVRGATIILISKKEMMLYLYDYNGRLIQKSSISCGRIYGNKKIVGDNKTPEGIFYMASIERSNEWKHDFMDGKGMINGAYGPYFIRLNVPGQKGIGIHGTHLDSSIGSRASEGCIRMKNEDIEKLIKRIKSTTLVIITPSQQDVDADAIEVNVPHSCFKCVGQN